MKINSIRRTVKRTRTEEKDTRRHMKEERHNINPLVF
jgi:hypothetical protein